MNEIQMLLLRIQMLEQRIVTLENQMSVALGATLQMRRELNQFAEKVGKDIGLIKKDLVVLVEDFVIKEEQHLYRILSSLEIGRTQEYPM